MRVRSFAKINLGIEILGKRQDGYHELRTLFQTVDLYDDLVFKLSPEDQILLKGDNPAVTWDSRNLIYRAAQIIRRKADVFFGVEIHVQKNIPVGAGLGGGSSNAAVTLFVLNKLWNLRLSDSELLDTAKRLGADVPYFLKGGLCLGTGIGDVLTPQEEKDPFFCLLVFPGFSIITGDIYRRYQPALTSSRKESKIIEFLKSRDFSLLNNGLEETILRHYPQLKTIKTLLSSLGAEMSQVSGTGSAVYGVFFDKKRAETAVGEIGKEYTVFLVRTLSRELYWKKINAGV